MHFGVAGVSWGKDMVAMSSSGPGYIQAIIVLHAHHDFSRSCHDEEASGTLRQFLGQGVQHFYLSYHRQPRRSGCQYVNIAIDKMG